MEHGAWKPRWPLHLGRALRKQIARHGARGQALLGNGADHPALGRHGATSAISHGHDFARSESCTYSNLPQRCATASTGISTVQYCTLLVQYLTNRTVNTHLGSTVRPSHLPPPHSPHLAPPRQDSFRSGQVQIPRKPRWSSAGVDHLGCQGGRPRPHRGQCRADHPVQDTVRPFRPTQQPFKRFPSRQSWRTFGIVFGSRVIAEKCDWIATHCRPVRDELGPKWEGRSGKSPDAVYRSKYCTVLYQYTVRYGYFVSFSLIPKSISIKSQVGPLPCCFRMENRC